MAMNPFKNSFFIGVTSGLVAALIAPILIPAIKRSSRPIAKGLIKGGMVLYEKGREVTAHAGEVVEDVMAEIQAEQAERQSGGSDDSEWEGTEPSRGNGGLHPTLAEEDKNRTGQHRTTSS